jgi:hypothetical protein
MSENHGVGGSIPPLGTNNFKDLGSNQPFPLNARVNAMSTVAMHRVASMPCRLLIGVRGAPYAAGAIPDTHETSRKDLSKGEHDRKVCVVEMTFVGGKASPHAIP